MNTEQKNTVEIEVLPRTQKVIYNMIDEMMRFQLDKSTAMDGLRDKLKNSIGMDMPETKVQNISVDELVFAGIMFYKWLMIMPEKSTIESLKSAVYFHLHEIGESIRPDDTPDKNAPNDFSLDDLLDDLLS